MWDHGSEDVVKTVAGTSMRKYVKSWVTEWDLLRLFPGEECEIEVSSWKSSYEEPQDIPEEHVAEASHSAPLAEGSAESSNVPAEEAELVAPASSTIPIASITPTS